MSTLKGGEPAGKPEAINFKEGTPDSQADRALAKLKELAASFADESKPYSRSCIRCGRRITATTTIWRA